MIIVPSIFLLFILGLFVRGFRYSPNIQKSTNTPNGISIVIPFRNEADNLKNLLTSLANQKVAIPFELILVNDRSTDNFLPIFETTQKIFQQLSVFIVNNKFDPLVNLTSKQQAIDTGVNASQFEMIVLTDADMIFSEMWLDSLLCHFDSTNTPFVFGRTAIVNGTGILCAVQKIQLDFLFATAHLFSKCGLDSSCMGNNIAISKDLYTSIGGQKGIGFTIVEDKKLLAAVKKQGITPIPVDPFLPLAYTYAVDSPTIFLHQMIRWLRGGATESLQILSVVILLGMEIISVGAMIFGSPTNSFAIVTALGIILTWALFIFEFKRVTPVSRGFQLPWFLIIIAIESLILIPSLFFISPKWKGTTLQSRGKTRC